MLAVINIMDNIATIVYFFIGAILGLILILIAIYILGKISNDYLSKTHYKNELKPLNNPEDIINDAINNYTNNYSKKIISQRFIGLKDISYKMIQDIAFLYSPNKKNPELDIDLQTSFNIIKDAIKQIDKLVDSVIDSQAFKTVWKSYALLVKTSNLFKKIFKKDQSTIDTDISMNIRSMRASYVMKRLKKSSNTSLVEEENIEPSVKKEVTESTKKSYFLLDGLINNKILSFIKDLGYETIKIYNNSYFNEKEKARGEKK